MATDFIVKKKANEWATAAQFIKTGINKYEEEVDAFYELFFAPMAPVKKAYIEERTNKLRKLANDISSKEPELAAEINKFIGICNIHFTDAQKFNKFKEALQEEPIFAEIKQQQNRQSKEEEDFNRKQQEEIRRRQQEQQQRKQEEQRRWEEEQERQQRDRDQRRREEEQRRRQQEEILRRQRQKEKAKKNRKRFWRICTFLAVIAAIVMLAYKYMPGLLEGDNTDTPRYYTYTNLNLRSSKDASSSKNQITIIPYGTKLIVYDMDADGWATVKIDQPGNGKKGYVASEFLVNSTNFDLLDKVWGNEEAKEAVNTAKCRYAILNYLNENTLPTGPTGWQLFTEAKDKTPNTVIFPRLSNGYNDFSDFGFILKNNETKERKLVVYSFEKNGTPVLVHEAKAPEDGLISSLKYSNKKYRASYTSQATKPTETQANRQPATPTETAAPKAEPSFTISNVLFANGSQQGKLITQYGSQIYSDTEFLQIQVLYNSKVDLTTTFNLKLVGPDGKVRGGSTSPANFTYKTGNMNITKGSNKLYMPSWGHSSGTYYVPGKYTLELWHNGERVYRTTFNVLSK